MRKVHIQKTGVRCTMKNKWCCDMIQVPKSFALDLRPNMLHNSSHDGLLKTVGQGEK
jgi:hypothetical protein